MKYRAGTLYNQKHAAWLKHSISLICPLCPQLDSALHILSGCQHTQIRNMISERHNLACSMIFKAISKTGSLGSCFVCMDKGSSERLCKISRFPIQLKPGLYQSGSFQPASHTKIGLPPSHPYAVWLHWLISSLQKLKSNRLAMKEGGFLEWQGSTEGDWEHLSSTANH